MFLFHDCLCLGLWHWIFAWPKLGIFIIFAQNLLALKRELPALFKQNFCHQKFVLNVMSCQSKQNYCTYVLEMADRLIFQGKKLCVWLTNILYKKWQLLWLVWSSRISYPPVKVNSDPDPHPRIQWELWWGSDSLLAVFSVRVHRAFARFFILVQCRWACGRGLLFGVSSFISTLLVQCNCDNFDNTTGRDNTNRER